MANFVTSFYFIYFIVILPVAGYVENKVINSILKFRKTEDLSSFIKKISFQNNNINNTIKGSSVALLVPFADMEPTNFIDSSLDFFVFFFSNVTFFYVFSFVLLLSLVFDDEAGVLLNIALRFRTLNALVSSTSGFTRTGLFSSSK